MIQRRCKPSISSDDIERMMYLLEDARHYVIRFKSAQPFRSQASAIAENLLIAMKDLAKEALGNENFFMPLPHSATGSEELISRARAREARKLKLLGRWLPGTVRKIPFAVT